MDSIIRVMAKEIRRMRVLAEVTEKYGLSSTSSLESMRRLLAMMIKREQKHET